ncbi:MAG: hypothetical protein ACRD3B_07985 [Candidatus Sulfotelmatobacter sp.]
MRRLMYIVAFALFLGVPLWAQRGGHGASGGHFSGGHSFAGHSSGFASHGFSAGRMGAGHFSGGHFSNGRVSNGRNGFRGSFPSSRFRGPIIGNSFRGRFRNRGFSNNCFGFRCRTGFFNPWWGYDPWLWSDWNDMDSRFDADYYNNLALANQMDQQSLNQQNIEQQRLLRQEQEDGDQDSYAPRAVAPRASPSMEEQRGSPAVPATVLVFRDEHQQEVQNYAIVGQTLWNFAPGRTQKIPLSSLDLAATEKANDDRGITFRVLAANEAQ